MVKKSQEAYVTYLNSLAAVGSSTGASRATGISAVTAYRWLAASRAAAKNPDEPSEYRFEYPPGAGEVAYLHEHAKLVTRTIVQDIMQNALIRARDGTWSVARKDGRTVYCENPDFEETKETEGLDDATLALLGYPTRWLRDASFKKIPKMIHTAPSNELSLAMLAAFSKRFAKRLSVEHQHQHSGGVQVAHSVGSMPRKQLEKQQALPMVEIVEPVAEEIVDMSMASEPESEPFTEEPAPEQTPAPMPEPMPTPAPQPRVGLTDLQRDLLEKAREKGLKI
jgi:hypothetical protein